MVCHVRKCPARLWYTIEDVNPIRFNYRKTERVFRVIAYTLLVAVGSWLSRSFSQRVYNRWKGVLVQAGNKRASPFHCPWQSKTPYISHNWQPVKIIYLIFVLLQKRAQRLQFYAHIHSGILIPYAIKLILSSRGEISVTHVSHLEEIQVAKFWKALFQE